MRWIVGSSLKFRFIVVALTAFLMFFGVQQLGDTAVDVFPEFAPPEGRDPHRRHRAGAHRGRRADHRPAGAVVQRDSRVSRRSGPDRSSSCRRSCCSSSRERTCSRRASSSRSGSPRSRPTLPTWAAPPVMLQPLSATSRVLKIGLSSADPQLDLMDLSMTAYWKIRARLLRVPGVANVPIWGERLEMLQVQADPRPARRAEGHARAGHDRDRERARRRPAVQYSRRALHRPRRVDRRPRAERIGIRHVQPIVTHEDLANLPITTTDGRHDSARRRGRPRQGPSTAHRRCGHQRGRRPDAHRREAARGPTRWTSPRVSRRRSTRCDQVSTGIAVDSAIFRPATFIEDAIDNLTQGADPRCAADDPDARPVPVLVANRRHQRRRDPAVAARSRCSC